MVRKDFMLIGMDDGFLSLMDDNGDTRDDLKCPEDSVGDEIKKAIADEVDILVCGRKHQHHMFPSFSFSWTSKGFLSVYCVDRLW